MADETIRDLERQAAQGDRVALARLLVERARAGDLDGVVLLGHCHRCAWWSNDERNPWNWGFCRVAETRVVTWMRERPPGLDPRYAEETEYEPVAGDGAMACAEPRAAEEQEGDGAELFTRGDFGCVQWTKTEPGLFTAWLQAQKAREDGVGFAARWAGSLSNWPQGRDWSFDEILFALDCNSGEFVNSTTGRRLREAWDEWLFTAFRQRQHPLPRVRDPRDVERERRQREEADGDQT